MAKRQRTIHEVIMDRCIIDMLSKCGRPASDFNWDEIVAENVDPDKESEFDENEDGKIKVQQDDKIKYYYYDKKANAKFDGGGVIDSRSRDFCVEMISLGKVWTREEINRVSFTLRYSVFKYAGGYNCRHTWKVFRYRKLDPPSKSERANNRDIKRLKRAAEGE
jgi:hypothetical protein